MCETDTFLETYYGKEAVSDRLKRVFLSVARHENKGAKTSTHKRRSCEGLALRTLDRNNLVARVRIVYNWSVASQPTCINWAGQSPGASEVLWAPSNFADLKTTKSQVQ